MGGSREEGFQDFVGGSREEAEMTQLQRKRWAQSKLAAYARKAKRVAAMDGFLPKHCEAESLVNVPRSPDLFSSDTALDVDILKYLHPHDRDLRVQFFSKEHVYFVDKKKVRGSVTGVVHTFAESFDADSVIGGMQRSANWPRVGYLRQHVTFDDIQPLHIASPQLLELFAGSPRDETQICRLLQALRHDPALQEKISRLAKTTDEIKAEWTNNGQRAAHYGTYMHYVFEAYLNGHVVPCSPEVEMLQKFLCSLRNNCKAWRTEWLIFAEEEQIAGSIDFVGRRDDGTFILVDWKRTAGLRATTFCTSFRRMMKQPLQHLQDTKEIHYCLQLNTYRHILEKYYNITVSAMFVVCCHPEHRDNPLILPVSRMEKETVDMLRAWRDYEGGSTTEPHRTAERRILLSGTVRRYQRLFDVHPMAADLLPNPEEWAQESKRHWEKCMCMLRTLLRLLHDDFENKTYILYMYVHCRLQKDRCLQARMTTMVPHPRETGLSDVAWLSSLLEFVVRDAKHFLCGAPVNTNNLPLLVSSIEGETVDMLRGWPDYEGGSTTEPHRTDDRRILISGTIRRYQRLFDVQPMATVLLPNPEEWAQETKRHWEKCMFLLRTFLKLLHDDFENKTYILYMYVHCRLQGDKILQDHMTTMVQHPRETDLSDVAWISSLLEFVVQNARRRLFGAPINIEDFVGGASSSRDGQHGVVEDEEVADMPEIGMLSDEEGNSAAGVLQAAAVFASQVSPGQEPVEEIIPMPSQDEINDLNLGQDADGFEKSARLDRARKRRLLPGADSTMSRFEQFFENLTLVANEHLAIVVPRVPDGEPSIPDKVSRIRQHILQKFPSMNESLLRISTGAISVYRLRLTDLHVRELVMLLWIVEGDIHMRCHEGNLFFFFSMVLSLCIEVSRRKTHLPESNGFSCNWKDCSDL